MRKPNASAFVFGLPGLFTLVALAHACGDGGASPDDGTGGSGGGTATSTNDAGVDRDADDPIVPHAPSCAKAASGSSGDVAAPTLELTLPASWDENWFASPALIDLDHDGQLEIIAARHSVLYAWSNDGAVMWQTAFGHSAASSPDHGVSRMWASPVCGDLNGDGEVECAVGSDADSDLAVNLAVYDHAGNLLPGWPIAFGTTELRGVAGADVDADGVVEILASKTAKGPATGVFELDGAFHPGYPQVNNATCDPDPPAEPCWDYGGFNQTIGAGDIDGNGTLDVISTYDAIAFGVFHGEDGSPFAPAEAFADRVITSVEAYHDPALSQQGWGTGDRTEFTYSPPVVADIDADGDLEYVLAGDHEHSQSTENQGTTLWVLNHDMTRPTGWEWPKDSGPPLVYDGDLGQNIVHTQPSPAVGNIDGEPGLEILYPSYDGKLYAYHPDGTLYWSYAFATVALPFTGASEPLIVDLNGDGVPEVVFSTYSSGSPGEPDTPAHLIILNAGGQELHRIELAGRGSMAPPSIADLDADGELELVISLKDTLGGGQGGVQIWSLPGSATNCVLWGTGRGGLLRQGYVPVK